MKFENTEVWGFEHAIRGMRNPKNSWNRSDSVFAQKPVFNDDGDFVKHKDVVSIGENDLELMQTLIKAGSEHRKFMRQIFVSVDITAPLYWWKEFDTYKIGTTANSTSTMHKLASTPITMNCFEMDDFENMSFGKKKVYGVEFEKDLNYIWGRHIEFYETLRQKYNETKDKRYWKELIRLLPESWLQTRTVTMTYENILNMYRQRKNHKLTEWSKSFIEWVETLPYANELIMLEGK